VAKGSFAARAQTTVARNGGKGGVDSMSIDLTLARSGMSLEACKRAARRLGGSVERIRRTGEIRFFHPAIGSSGMINNRRKDAPLHAIAWLRRLQRLAPERSER